MGKIRQSDNNMHNCLNFKYAHHAFRTFGAFLICLLIVIGEHGACGQIKFGEVSAVIISFPRQVYLKILS